MNFLLHHHYRKCDQARSKHRAAAAFSLAFCICLILNLPLAVLAATIPLIIYTAKEKMNFRPTATKSRTIILRSNEATHKIDESSAVFVLDDKILIPPNSHALISLQSATIPLSMLMVNAHTNRLVVNSSNISLDYGNYNVTTMLTQLQTKLSGYTVTYSSSLNTFTITHSSSTFTIGAESTCLPLLGFSNDGAHASVASLSQTSDQSVDLSGIPAFNVNFVKACINHSNLPII